MFTLERAPGDRPVTVWSLIGLVLLPLVVAAGFVGATWDSADRLNRVEAAVVNLDEPVTLDGQIVPLGRQLAGGLVGSADEDSEENFSWVLTDGDDAADGLAAGRYAAVVTIPENFSARATSYAGQQPGAARPAEIDVRTTAVGGLTDTALGQVIAETARRTLNTELTQAYLENIYLGFGTLHDQFGTLADGSDQLADGTEDLADGLSATASGGGQLADGLGQLADGVGDVAVGAQQLSTGTEDLATGLRQLTDGTADLPGQTRALARGAEQAADGIAQAATGAGDLSDGLVAYTDGADRYAAGVGAYVAGAGELGAGVSEFRAGVGAYAGGLAGFAAAMEQLAVDGLPCPDTLTGQACAVYQQGVRAGAAAALQGLNGGAEQPGLVAGAAGLADGAAALDAGAGRLAADGTRLVEGAGGLSTGAQSLSAGAERLAGGLEEAEPGLRRLAGGADRLADGLAALQTGLAGSADGAGQLAAGVSGLSTGLRALATGTASSAGGADDLAQGLAQLSGGAEDLASGSREFAQGVAEGADQVPAYSAAERTRLASVVSTPVRATQPGSLFADQASTTYLAVVALWIGALATYLVVRAVTGRALLSSRSSWRLTLAGLAPGAAVAGVQAIVLAVVLQQLLDLDAARVSRLVPYALLIAMTFVAVNHALVAWFGGVGRFVSATVVVLAAAGAITAALPRFFDVVLPLLPTTPALAGLRALVTGGPGLGAATTLLLGWLVLALIASLAAVARRRTVPAPVAAWGLAAAP